MVRFEDAPAEDGRKRKEINKDGDINSITTRTHGNTDPLDGPKQSSSSLPTPDYRLPSADQPLAVAPGQRGAGINIRVVINWRGGLRDPCEEQRSREN
ncbi:hypothetical protein ZHAS_00009434 [Anopheles sinensis]|uniref:Uncharacterized protein n=1 Tax=Anopheles sinensis TaxID=74873 RepID=A0A084VUZ6_ANOSI|nr:hypothetical protein ZHAS_00009434 [Anopheles sinensis]